MPKRTLTRAVRRCRQIIGQSDRQGCVMRSGFLGKAAAFVLLAVRHAGAGRRGSPRIPIPARATRTRTKAWPPPKRMPVQGIDVSWYQLDIDWREVRKAGTRFAFIKATEGGDMLDRRFRENWRESREAGVPRGAYHFVFWCRPARTRSAGSSRTCRRSRTPCRRCSTSSGATRPAAAAPRRRRRAPRCARCCAPSRPITARSPSSTPTSPSTRTCWRERRSSTTIRSGSDRSRPARRSATATVSGSSGSSRHRPRSRGRGRR